MLFVLTVSLAAGWKATPLVSLDCKAKNEYRLVLGGLKSDLKPLASGKGRSDDIVCLSCFSLILPVGRPDWKKENTVFKRNLYE